jgi:hypothetical protein
LTIRRSVVHSKVDNGYSCLGLQTRPGELWLSSTVPLQMPFDLGLWCVFCWSCGALVIGCFIFCEFSIYWNCLEATFLFNMWKFVYFSMYFSTRSTHRVDLLVNLSSRRLPPSPIPRPLPLLYHMYSYCHPCLRLPSPLLCCRPLPPNFNGNSLTCSVSQPQDLHHLVVSIAVAVAVAAATALALA